MHRPRARLVRGLKTPQGAQASCACWSATWLEAGRARQGRGEGVVHVQLNRFQRKCNSANLDAIALHLGVSLAAHQFVPALHEVPE